MYTACVHFRLVVGGQPEAARLWTDAPRCAAVCLSVVCVMVGGCSSVGCTVQGESPRSIQEKIDSKEIVIPDE